MNKHSKTAFSLSEADRRIARDAVRRGETCGVYEIIFSDMLDPEELELRKMMLVRRLESRTSVLSMVPSEEDPERGLVCTITSQNRPEKTALLAWGEGVRFLAYREIDAEVIESEGRLMSFPLDRKNRIPLWSHDMTGSRSIPRAFESLVDELDAALPAGSHEITGRLVNLLQNQFWPRARELYQMLTPWAPVQGGNLPDAVFDPVKLRVLYVMLVSTIVKQGVSGGVFSFGGTASEPLLSIQPATGDWPSLSRRWNGSDELPAGCFRLPVSLSPGETV